MSANEVQIVDKWSESLARDRDEFLARGFRFEWWIHGGEPGPDWTSDSLEVQCDRAGIHAKYIRARFKFERDPHQYSELFELELGKDQAARFFEEVFRSPLFRRSFPEEQDQGLRDNLEESWDLAEGKTHLAKTLREPFPESSASLRERCRALGEQIARTGVRKQSGD